MESRKTERLLNLLIMLLVQRHFVAKERIREILYPEAGTEAFEKMFERDKEELRSLGVPIDVGTIDAYFDDEPGYRIRPDQLALPEVELSADEAAVVGLATKVWEHARLASATTEAVKKLAARGIDVDTEALEIAQPRLAADEPSFDAFWEATASRTPISFDYRRPGQPAAATRRLQPWGVVRHSGRWYAVGLDLDRGEERVFRLSRVEGAVTLTGAAGSYEVPAGTDVRAVTARLASARTPAPAVVLVRPDRCAPLRRQAERTDAGAAEVLGEVWDRLHLRHADADELLGYGPDVLAEQPVELVEQISSRLAALVDASRPAPSGAQA